jgi:hypothetical protein
MQHACVDIFPEHLPCLDGKASADSIQQDLGMSRAEQALLVLTWVRSRNSPYLKRIK